MAVKNPVAMVPTIQAPETTYGPSEAVQRDAQKFEAALAHYNLSTGEVLSDVLSDNELITAARLEASDVGEIDRMQSDKKKKSVVTSLGHAILDGLDHSSQELHHAYEEVNNVLRDGKKAFSPADLLRLDAAVLSATITVDVTTRVVSKVSTGVDTLLRIQ